MVIFLIPSIVTTVQAQYGGNVEPLTQEQLDFCAQYEISPCTENSILAKEAVINAQAPVYSPPASVSDDWLITRLIIVAVIAMVAIAIVAIKIKRPAKTEKI